MHWFLNPKENQFKLLCLKKSGKRFLALGFDVLKQKRQIYIKTSKNRFLKKYKSIYPKNVQINNEFFKYVLYTILLFNEDLWPRD